MLTGTKTFSSSPAIVLAAPHQVPAQRERDHGQHDIVDRPGERVLDRLDLVERRVRPREAPVGADLADVVGRRRRRSQARPGQRARADQGLRDPADGLARASHRGAQRAHELARVRRALEQGFDQESGAGGRGPWVPGPGLRLLRREQHAQDVHPRDTVDERVVGLGEKREPAAFDALHEPHLPQRPVAPQMVGEDAAGEHLQLVLAPRRRQRGVAHVVAQVEVLVVDPARAGLGERNLRQALPIARHQAETRVDVRQQPIVRGRVSGEDQRTTHVHVRRSVLQMQERCVQRAEPIPGHGTVGVP